MGPFWGLPEGNLQAKYQDIVEFSELGNFITMPLGTYSQGMRLRLGFSIIANLEFDILLIDEVLAVGDALFQNKCFEHLMSFKNSGKSLVVTTQDLSLIERLSDKVILLEHGKCVFTGSPHSGVNKYQALLNKDKFYVGAKPEGLVEQTKKWADPPEVRGKKLGSGEAEINNFTILEDEVKTGGSLTIKVDFSANTRLESPHFGIAIFRKDGVYCYGPNTQFDGLDINHISSGKHSFSLKYHSILIAPGDYTVSVAIWDKNETISLCLS